MDEVDIERIVRYIVGLQNDDGSFSGDQWGEVDTRFSFCAIACLALIVSTFTGLCTFVSSTFFSFLIKKA